MHERRPITGKQSHVNTVSSPEQLYFLKQCPPEQQVLAICVLGESYQEQNRVISPMRIMEMVWNTVSHSGTSFDYSFFFRFSKLGKTLPLYRLVIGSKLSPEASNLHFLGAETLMRW